MFAAPAHRLRLGVEAAAVADLAQHFHIGQEVHFDGAHALAFTTRTAALAGVEAEAPGAIAARLGLQGVGKQLADGVPKTNVGGGATARGFANRGLVHLQHPVDAGIALHAHTTDPGRVFASFVGLAPGLAGSLAHRCRHVVQQHVARQSGFARTADAGDGHQAAQGDLHIDLAQVVQKRAVHMQTA